MSINTARGTLKWSLDRFVFRKADIWIAGNPGVLCAVLLSLAIAPKSVYASPTYSGQPLSAEVAASLRFVHERSPIDVSPDGRWIAYTLKTDEAEDRQRGSEYSATGVPFAEGARRMRAAVTNVISGQEVALGSAESQSWDPVWSPNGDAVAFYSDMGGQAAVWIWHRSTGRVEQFPQVIPRPFFGFEVIRWSLDGRKLLCKILPERLTLSEANARRGPSSSGSNFREQAVTVLRYPNNTYTLSGEQSSQGLPDFLRSRDADLAILDLRNHSVLRIARAVQAHWYAYSPDQRFIAYTDLIGSEGTTEQAEYHLFVYDTMNGETKRIGESLRLSYGTEVSWAPDSRHIAYITGGPQASGAVSVIAVDSDLTKTFTKAAIPRFDSTHGQRPPLWDSQSKAIYVVSRDGDLWILDVITGSARPVARIPGFAIVTLVSRHRHEAIWLRESREVWVVARSRDRQTFGFFKLDLLRHRVSQVIAQRKTYRTLYGLDLIEATSTIVFIAEDQTDPPDVWALQTSTKRVRQVTHINNQLANVAWGQTRVVEWQRSDGAKLRGTLLLPSSYRPGNRHPLIVWLYGGESGSNFANTFGLWGETPVFNMQVLSTRGYAVLFPDAPIRQGKPIEDLTDAVVSAVDALISDGLVDAERLAIMGQSYGSYCVLGIITRTSRFKAAVITAAVLHPDLLAAYLELTPEGSAPNIEYLEGGQGAMGGSPWEFPDRYRENSPIYKLDRIETALLIGQGKEDIGQLSAADAIFVGLRRLGKSVEYRLYAHEEHVITKKSNVIDFWNRRLQFLAEHLNVALDREGRVAVEVIDSQIQGSKH